MRGLRGAVGCAGGCQRRRDTAGGCWWFYVAQIHVQTPPGPAQRARFARPPWLDGCGQAAAAERWLGQKGLLCSMPLVVPRGTRLGPMAVGWPMASLGATRTSPTLLAVSVPDASAVSAVSRVVGWGGGRVGRTMAGAGGRRRRPGRRQAHAGLSVGPGDCIDQRSTRCQRVRAAPASPTACCPREGTACRGRGAWRP